jgi:orotate phosphoribosyltransferase
MGADPIACAALAGGADVKAFFVRKERKEHGLSRWIEGPPLEPGERCLVVEDVVTSGGALLDSVEALREAGLVVGEAICIVDREEGGTEALAAHSVRLRALFRAEELVSVGKNPAKPHG